MRWDGERPPPSGAATTLLTWGGPWALESGAVSIKDAGKIVGYSLGFIAAPKALAWLMLLPGFFCRLSSGQSRR